MVDERRRAVKKPPCPAAGTGLSADRLIGLPPVEKRSIGTFTSSQLPTRTRRSLFLFGRAALGAASRVSAHRWVSCLTGGSLGRSRSRRAGASLARSRGAGGSARALHLLQRLLCALGGTGAHTTTHRAAGPAQPRVEQVAQRVADHVEATVSSSSRPGNDIQATTTRCTASVLSQKFARSKS